MEPGGAAARCVPAAILYSAVLLSVPRATLCRDSLHLSLRATLCVGSRSICPAVQPCTALCAHGCTAIRCCTTRSAYNLAQQEGVEMPITTEVFRILYENKPGGQAVMDLMGRDLKRERA